MDQHVDVRSKFSLARYACGENSKLALNGGLLGIKCLEVTSWENQKSVIRQGDEIAWTYRRKTQFAKVDAIMSKDADTVNRTRKTCRIADTVIVWALLPNGEKIGLIVAAIIPLRESDEDETPMVPDTIEELIDLL